MRASARAAIRLSILGLGATLAATAQARLVVDHLVVEGKSKMTNRAMSARMKLRPGDRLDFEKLASARLRLLESELFTSVKVYIDLPVDEAARRMYVEEADEKIDVHVELQEKTSWFVVPTASFGSGDYAAGAAYGDQDLGGHDLQIVAAAQYGQARSYLFAAFRDPLVNGAPLTWAISGLVREERIRFFADHAKVLEVPTLIYGGVAELGWVLSPHLRMLAGFSARHQHVGAAEGLDPDLTPPAYNPASGRIFVLSLQSSYEDTSAPEGLRRGVRMLLKNELSDHYWGSRFDYAKLELRAELYGQLAWNYPSLIIDAVFDYPTSSDGVPLTEMLRIGGSSLRGYLVNEFHGDTLVSLQLEDQAMLFRRLPLPFVDSRFNVAAAIFVDAAALLERHPGGTTVDVPAAVRPALGDFHTSVGAGLRIILPGVAIPALKADVGYGIDVKSFALTVSIGGGS